MAADFEGDPRPQGEGFDIGFDEVMPVFKVFLPVLLVQ